jgi:hypothetical protein
MLQQFYGPVIGLDPDAARFHGQYFAGFQVLGGRTGLAQAPNRARPSLPVHVRSGIGTRQGAGEIVQGARSHAEIQPAIVRAALAPGIGRGRVLRPALEGFICQARQEFRDLSASRTRNFLIKRLGLVFIGNGDGLLRKNVAAVMPSSSATKEMTASPDSRRASTSAASADRPNAAVTIRLTAASSPGAASRTIM